MTNKAPTPSSTPSDAQVRARAVQELRSRNNLAESPDFRKFVPQVSPKYLPPDHLRPIYILAARILTLPSAQVVVPTSPEQATLGSDMLSPSGGHSPYKGGPLYIDWATPILNTALRMFAEIRKEVGLDQPLVGQALEDAGAKITRYIQETDPSGMSYYVCWEPSDEQKDEISAVLTQFPEYADIEHRIQTAAASGLAEDPVLAARKKELWDEAVEAVRLRDHPFLEPVMGGGVRAVFNAPPRHAKTETFLHLISLFEKTFPYKNSAYVSYNQMQAETKAVVAQDIMMRAGLRADPRMANKAEWKIDGQDGRLFATGVGGTLTGKGVHFMVIDDSLKNREDAESETIRSSQVEWLNDVAETRIEPGGSFIITMTRWHEADLCGAVKVRTKLVFVCSHIKDESLRASLGLPPLDQKFLLPEFEFIRIPAVADGLNAVGRRVRLKDFNAITAVGGVQRALGSDGQGNIIIEGTITRLKDNNPASRMPPEAGIVSKFIPPAQKELVYNLGDQVNMDPLGRNVGEVLWEARYNKDYMSNVQRNKENTFISLYQGLPRSEADQIFKGVKYYNPYNPAEVIGSGAEREVGPLGSYYEIAAAADLAYTEATHSNHSAYGFAHYRGRRVQLKFFDQWKRDINYTANRLLQLQNTHGAIIAMEANGPQAGVVGLLRARGIQIRVAKLPGDKIAKSVAVAEAWNAGDIEVPSGEPWVAELLEVLYDFTGHNDESDDAVDMIAKLYDTVLKRIPAHARVAQNGGTDPLAPNGSHNVYTPY